MSGGGRGLSVTPCRSQGARTAWLDKPVLIRAGSGHLIRGFWVTHLVMCIKKREIFQWACTKGINSVSTKVVCEFLGQVFPKSNFSLASPSSVQHFTSKLRAKWNAAGRSEQRFLSQNRQWLDGELCLPGQDCLTRPTGARSEPSFSELSRVSKLRKTQDLRQQPWEQLTFAAASAAYSNGHRAVPWSSLACRRRVRG